MPAAFYQLVSGRSLREVREQVARLEKNGYRAFGRAYKTVSAPDGKLDGNRFFQAMLREEREGAESGFSSPSDQTLTEAANQRR